MSERPDCNRSFEEHLLSGYLDGALTQGDAQRVKLHLQECEVCRQIYYDLQRMREATMSTTFEPIEDDQWNEAPRSRLSRLARNLGFALVGLWLLTVLALMAAPLDADPPEILARILAGGAIGASALLLLSVVLDRWRTSKSDIYREVKK